MATQFHDEVQWHDLKRALWVGLAQPLFDVLEPIVHPTKPPEIAKSPPLKDGFKFWNTLIIDHVQIPVAIHVPLKKDLVCFHFQKVQRPTFPYSYLHHSGNRVDDGKGHTPAQSMCRLCHSWRMLSRVGQKTVRPRQFQNLYFVKECLIYLSFIHT